MSSGEDLDNMLEGKQSNDIGVKDLQALDIKRDFKADEEDYEEEGEDYEEEGEFGSDGSDGEWEPPFNQTLSGTKRTIDQIYDNNEHNGMQAKSYQQIIQEKKLRVREEHDRVIQEYLYKRCPYSIVAKRDLAKLLDQKHYYPNNDQSVFENYKTLTTSMLEMQKAVKHTVQMGHANRQIFLKAVITISILITITLVINVLIFVFIGLDQMPMLKSAINNVITLYPVTTQGQVDTDGNFVN